MATPSLSATFNFVKKYPITLCGFSLIFMPSVHRLLLYFTPLLLSTAIFIVAMMSWGPSASSERSTTRRGKRKSVVEHPDWAFHESMEMEEEEEEEEEGEEEEEDHRGEVDMKASLNGTPSMDVHKEDIAQKGEVELDCGLELRGELEPEPDLCESAAGTTASRQGEPDPDLQGGGVGQLQAEPDPDLQEEGVGTTAKDDMHVHDASILTHAAQGHVHDGHEEPHGMTHCGHDTDAHEGSDASRHAHDDGHAVPASHAMHQQQPHGHAQEASHTPSEQSSYTIERLVQVSA